MLKNISISVGAVLASFLACELISRALLPPQQTVKVEHTSLSRTAAVASQVREDDGRIDTLLDWSGQHGIRLRPNVAATIQHHMLSQRDILIETNSLGLRHPELPPKSSDQYRVLVMGDSITLGDYLPREQTYPYILEKRLSKRAQDVHVINAGLPGASSFDEYYHYLEIKDAVQPDLVLVGMYLNDAQNSHKFYSRALAAPFSSSRFLTWLANRIGLLRSHLFIRQSADDIDPSWKEDFRAGRALHSGYFLRDQDAFDFEVYNAAVDFGLGWNPKAWDNLKAIIGTFAKVVRQESRKFGLFLFPVSFQVLGSVDDRKPQESFLEMCSSLGVPCLDLLPELQRAHQKDPQSMFFDHCHLTEFGNEIAANSLSSWLRRESLVY